MVGRIVNKLNEVKSLLLLSKIARRVWSEHLTYLPPSKLLRIEQEIARSKARGVPGDFCEFGVALGGSGIVMASKLGNERSFHGFDVFGMIPAPTSEKDGSKSYQRYKEIKDGKSKGLGNQIYYGYVDNLFEKVQQSFARFGLPVSDKTKLHQGLFEDTWPKVRSQIKSLAVVHIDCDWYEPVQYCLEICKEKLSNGGSVIVDDYYAYPGAKAATDEFLLNNSEFRLIEAGKHVVLWRGTN